jgi:tetratricopeptide (TPR) repeat protein
MSHDVETRSLDPCPDPELLATFLDGRLIESERAALAAHLTRCEACYAVVLAASQTKAVALDAAEASRPWYRTRRVLVSATSGLAAAAALVIAVNLGVMPGLGAPQLELEQALVAAVGTERRIEPRLTGGFAYAPMPGAVRSAATPSLPLPPSPDVRIAAARIEKRTSGRATAAAEHARGVAAVTLGETDRAVGALQRAIDQEPENARALSDLAAAYLVRAERDRDAGDLAKALAAANRALNVDRSLAEAWFNRALALERLSMHEEARESWKGYLTIDDQSGWADEARAHVRALNGRRAP